MYREKSGVFIKFLILAGAYACAFFITCLNIVYAYEITDNEVREIVNEETGELVVYKQALDFGYPNNVYEQLCNNIGSPHLIGVRNGLSAQKFAQILAANQPSHMFTKEYVYTVEKVDKNLMKVWVLPRTAKYEERHALEERLFEIKDEINAKGIDSEKAKMIYDWMFDNLKYSKNSDANMYECLVLGQAANSDTLTAIYGRLCEMHTIINQSIYGYKGDKVHCFSYTNFPKNDYIVDIAQDLKTGNRYESFGKSTNNGWSTGALWASYKY